MNKKSLETLVLILGLLIIGTAIFFIFIQPKTMSSIFVTNLIISGGFLIYVLYSIMATNNLNKDIRNLEKHIDSLKGDIQEKNTAIEQKDKQIGDQNRRLDKNDKDLKAATQSIKGLEKELSDLRAQAKED